MFSPLSTAPLPSTSTQPRESKCQPGPLDTWPGTVFSFVPDGTPVFVASGKPHTLGTAEQFVWPVAFGTGCRELAKDVEGMIWVHTRATAPAPARLAATPRATRRVRLRGRCGSCELVTVLE